MNEKRQLSIQLLAVAAIFAVPYIGAYIVYNGDFPKDYFAFPHLSAVDKYCFSMPVFVGISILGAIMAAFVIFPGIFGFKKVEKPVVPAVKKVSLPTWFWVGLVMWGAAIASFVFKWSSPKLLVNWVDLPLFWGFTLMLDGWVYVRKGGHSIIGDHPRAMFGIGVSAILGWLIFEYLNNYVLESWYYPMGELIPDDEFVIYAVLGSSGLIPPCIEIYALLRTFPALSVKYTQGPKITMPRWVEWALLIITVGSLFLAPFFPDILFGALWFSPMAMLAIVLDRCGIWNPFTPIKNGDYSYVVLLALSYLITGFCLEGWNYLSATHITGAPNYCGEVHQVMEMTHNASYWVYSIPFVDKFHIFEMPLLGFLGYLPFGVYCGVWWIFFAAMLGVKTDFANRGY